MGIKENSKKLTSKFKKKGAGKGNPTPKKPQGKMQALQQMSQQGPAAQGGDQMPPEILAQLQGGR